MFFGGINMFDRLELLLGKEGLNIPRRLVVNSLLVRIYFAFFIL